MSRVVTFGKTMGRLATPGFQRFRQAIPASMDVTFAGAEAKTTSGRCVTVPKIPATRSLSYRHQRLGWAFGAYLKGTDLAPRSEVEVGGTNAAAISAYSSAARSAALSC